ncbi:MAG: hypothetical protein IH795_08295 [Bacteroidetes bacterium]|nr:hypothetical protein [Bacteroidota bacterium]
MGIHVNPTTEEMCDVVIEYKKTPALSKQFLIGMAGYVTSVSPIITIFTDNYQKTLTENEPIASLADFEDIVKNLKRSKKYSMKDREEVLLLLGLATWCNAIDRKLGLYYFGK